MNIDNLTFISLVLLYLLAAFFCCAETAFTSVNRPRIRELAEQGGRRALSAFDLLENASSFFATVLLGTNLVHVTITTLVRALLAALIVNSPLFRRLAELANIDGDLESIATTLFVTPTLLVFSETLPKAIGRNNAERMTLLLARPVQFFRVLLKPFVVVIEWASGLLSSLLGIKEDAGEAGQVSRDDLKILASVAAEQGVIHQEASQLMTSLLELDNRAVATLMVPLDEIQMLPLNATLGDAEALACETGFTRFPVYGKRQTEIVGVVSLRQCLAEVRRNGLGEGAAISELMEKRVLFVHEDKTVGAMLLDFRESRQPMAIVVDANGGMVGLVTAEMLLELLLEGVAKKAN